MFTCLYVAWKWWAVMSGQTKNCRQLKVFAQKNGCYNHLWLLYTGKWAKRLLAMQRQGCTSLQRVLWNFVISLQVVYMLLYIHTSLLTVYSEEIITVLHLAFSGLNFQRLIHQTPNQMFRISIKLIDNMVIISVK